MMIKKSAEQAVLSIKQGEISSSPISIEILAEIDRMLSAQSDIISAKMKSFVVIYGVDKKRAIVTYPYISKTRLNIVSDKPLDHQNFTLILHDPDILGNILTSSLKERFSEERSTLRMALLFAILTFILLFYFSYPVSIRYLDYLNNVGETSIVQNLIHFYEVVGQSLITIMTLFLTVFVLFTISQNADISKNAELYANGLFHKYLRDDQYITMAAATSLITSALGLLLTAAPTDISFNIESIFISKLNFFVPILYAVSVATFIISLDSLKYYAQRVITTNEVNLVKQILDKREEQIRVTLSNSRRSNKTNGSKSDSPQG